MTAERSFDPAHLYGFTDLVRAKVPLDLAAWKRRTATLQDTSAVLTGPFRLYDPTAKDDPADHGLRVAYVPALDPSFTPLLDRIAWGLATHWSFVNDWRTGGMLYYSRTFGYQPRNSIRRDYCSSARSSRMHPATHTLLLQGASIAAHYYREWAPEHYALHMEAVERVLPEWKIAGTPFTSGIVNCNTPLQYHYDAGNYPGALSAQLTFRLGVQDGYLALPEYGLTIALAHQSLLLFQGQHALHGVTPFRLATPGPCPNGESYRFTVVYYALAGMWNCAPLGEELKRIQRLRTEREERALTRGHVRAGKAKGRDA